MKVKEAMMGTPYHVPLEANLGMATELMWKGNCGFLPVVDAEKKVCGVITDRDICVALGTRNQTAGQVRVEEVVQRKVYACNPEDDIHVALQTMREGHVRRLPVVDFSGNLTGVVSMDDLLLRAEPDRAGREPELSADEVVRGYRTIMKKDLPVSVKKAVA
ncbi:MAG TPA: CBS domain-containing protein [Candidatus Limnocylindrales bacterium]|nr:CBS domain-containing protein [Candidatus Limnocylindrales bacterium]